ncbi:YfjD family protein [Bacillus sp. 1NLA3E]|uniref:YfjD family protein n=1 Tax=Bacillus sp. 1NLA3E TaxID=666686 RepID=UPI000247ECD4|nr:YfjD family protein [Bacillus sp. 1NLA3E]AGK55704.1 transmembrane protein YfjD [Bacillus sp. 1NLA3E]
MNNENVNKPIQYEVILVLRILLLLATLGMGLASLWMFKGGLTFESSYSLIYIFIGIIGVIWGFTTFLMCFPAFTRKGKVLFTITQGENGQLISRKRTVYLRDIKDIKLDHYLLPPSGLIFQDLMIRTYQNKLIRIPTYNLLFDDVLKYYVENYMLSYMTEEAQQIWKKRFDKTTIA